VNVIGTAMFLAALLAILVAQFAGHRRRSGLRRPSR
jgi:hypothetical protein